MNKVCLFALLVGFSLGIKAQCPNNFSMQFQGQIAYPPNISALTMVADVLGRPYLYVASNELGLRILNTGSNSPTLVTSMDTVALSMRVMSVTQRDSVLFIVIGSTFNSSDPPGLVTVDVRDPTQPIVLDTWIQSGAGTGAAIVRLEDNIAYLGAAGNGLILLDIGDPSNIQWISQIVPDIHFPHSSNNPLKVNARGMEVKNRIVFLCYDAGGLRIINCTNLQQPIETGRYANPITFQPFNMPRAYNNVILRDTLLYVAVDYCGVEILSVADTGNIRLIHHWNPHNCPSGQWSGAPIHANELHLIPQCDLLFVSTGKSEMMVLDVSNPTQPDSCAWWGSVVDTTGSWGIALNDNSIFLSYSYVPTWIPAFLVPFYSTWSGVKKFSYTIQCAVGIPIPKTLKFQLYPNPARDVVIIQCETIGSATIELYSLEGQLLLRASTTQLNGYELGLPSSLKGMYLVQVRQGASRSTQLLQVIDE